VAAAALLAAGGAQADQKTDRLRSASASLASESHSVLLELYALESGLGRVERRLAALRAESQSVARREAAARSHLALVKRTLAEAEFRLGARLRELYTQGETDPLAVLLGSESLDEVIATLDNLGSFAKQDKTIVTQVKAARTDVKAALRDLAAQRVELRGLTAEAEAARSALLQVRSEKQAYLARLLRERRLNQSQLARLTDRAESAEAKASVIQESVPPPSESSPPPAPTGGVTSGTTMTVEATGYALKGTTATGVPVGWGIVAVDPSVIPLGTRMTIPGYGEGVAADTGGAVKGAIIDLWFPTTAQALAWGRRTVTITLH
jgi:3D (Asp-Asp-Asp) domain-containing protein/peptidoglycan hydrolase CwlO-like protein